MSSPPSIKIVATKRQPCQPNQLLTKIFRKEKLKSTWLQRKQEPGYSYRRLIVLKIIQLQICNGVELMEKARISSIQ